MLAKRQDVEGAAFKASLYAVFILSFAGYLANNPPITLELVFLIFKLLFVLFLVIGLHEAGHYGAARIMKLPIETYSVGLGPNLFKKKRNETTYQIQLFPIAGFVRLKENADERLNLLGKIFFYLAGVLVNLFCFVLALGVASFQSGKSFIEGINFALQKIPGAFEGFYIALINIRFEDVVNPNHDLVNNIGVYISLTEFVEQFWLGFAFLSLFAAIVNTIPVPILDGGRVVLAFLVSILRIFRIPDTAIKMFTACLLLSGVAIYFGPIIINNVWSNSIKLGMSLTEYLLWTALIVSIMMYFSIYFENRRNATVQ
jgi:membrane-associated protease RseP (regulator of RpoE activity)